MKLRHHSQELQEIQRNPNCNGLLDQIKRIETYGGTEQTPNAKYLCLGCGMIVIHWDD